MILPDKQLRIKLRKIKGWKLNGNQISKTFTLPDFVHAMGFVNQVALLSEKYNHHPDIDIRWNSVTLTLSTHSEGGITEKDFVLASAIEHL